MYRVAIDESQAEPFATPAETEEAHLGLIEKMRAAEAMAGAAAAAESGDAGTGAAETLAGLRDEIALFEARLVATGARLPDTSNRRALAQSMLDFWALRQSDLSALAMRFAPPEQQAAVRPEPPTAKLLAPYDPGTATDAATRAELCYAGLPDEATREAAKRGFLMLIQTDWALGGAETAALETFAEAQVLSRQPPDQPGPGFGLVHEELPTAWPRLAEWLAEDARLRSELDRVRSNAEAWSKTGSTAELPRGEGLKEVADLAKQDGTLLPYVQAAVERTRRERNIIYGVIAVIAALVIFSLASGIFAFGPWGKKQADESDTKSAQEIAAINQTAEQQLVVADTPQDDGKDTAAGSTGWIWLGSSDLPQIVLEDGTAVDPAKLTQGTLLRTRANLKIRSDKANAENIAGKRIGQVSGDVVVEMRGPAAAVTVGDTVQYWAQVRVIPVVYVQLAEGAALPLADLRGALEKAGFTVQPEQRLPNLGRIAAPVPFDVRYYYEQDARAAAETAAMVARWLGTAGPPPKDALIGLVGTPLAERVKTGTIEVWIYAS
ncbi:MAG: hypothetical protein O9266_04030 [Porphyrobacter sp.]|jgi:hypothetical protein|nr:hypothetical protein [Porphyrobacter sp.]